MRYTYSSNIVLIKVALSAISKKFSRYKLNIKYKKRRTDYYNIFLLYIMQQLYRFIAIYYFY